MINILYVAVADSEKSSQVDGACMEYVNWNVMPKAIHSIFILHYIWLSTNPYKYKIKFDG